MMREDGGRLTQILYNSIPCSFNAIHLFAMSMLWEQLRKTRTITSLELNFAVGALSAMSHKAQRLTAIPMPVYVT